jgi:hypothetical protein
MISAEEIKTEDGQIRMPVMVLGATHSRPNSKAPAAEAVSNSSPHKVNLSSNQLPVSLLSGLPATGLLVLAFLKLWLFEPLQ